ncbi:MAG: TetR/AcrR family transcriptional regulator, partial [Thermocrispum sp.]
VALFTKHGYAGTSLDTIAARARVTKGALYHHFRGKQDLFEAAFSSVEQNVHRRLSAILERPGNLWVKAGMVVREYLQSCLDPAYQRIVIHEAPVVMGWQRWRDAQDRLSFGLIRTAIADLRDAGGLVGLPVEVTARLVFGALSTAATMIANSPDPERVSEETEDAIVRLLALARAGVTEQGRDQTQDQARP